MSNDDNKWNSFKTDVDDEWNTQNKDDERDTQNPYEQDIWEYAMVTVPSIIVFAGIAVLIWQVYSYLKVGVWPEVSIITALEYFHVQWATSPTDWLGLYNFFDTLALSGSLIGAGIGLVFVIASGRD